MRRLHLELYFAIIGTLLAFLIGVGAVWHYFAAPRSAVWGVESAAGVAAQLLEDRTRRADPAAVLETLEDQLNADVLLYAPQANAPGVTRGRALVLTPEQLAQHGWFITREGPAFNRTLRDGSRLIVHPRRRFLLHGLHVVFILIAIGVTLALLTYPISRRLTARLARLQTAVEQFGGGNLEARVPVEGRDEVAALARSFNESATRIEQLVRSHRLLLANCSHELRTPLARIRMAIERIAPADRAAHEELARNIAELDGLIGEMLLASRLDAARGVERPEPIDLLALVAEEAAHFEREVAGAPVTISGDPALLRRLTRNLLDNARVHAGGATDVRVEHDEKFARLIVEDAGTGVHLSEREKIFEPFYRGAAGGNAGTGLGLAIVRQIARAHGGAIVHEAPAAGGSRFVVTLPR